MELKSEFERCIDALENCFDVIRRTKTRNSLKFLSKDVFESEATEIYEILQTDLTHMEAQAYVDMVLQVGANRALQVKVYIAHKDNMYCAVDENNEPQYL